MKKLAAVMASLFLSHVIAFADTPTVRQGTSRLSDPNKGTTRRLESQEKHGHTRALAQPMKKKVRAI